MKKCGISVDIGTTNITLHLIDLVTGKILKEVNFQNPQREYGEEIISRIDFARSPENAEILTRIIRSSVSEGVSSFFTDSECNQNDVDSVVVVGNTVMHHLFFGLSTKSLLKPPYKAEDKEAILISASDVDLDIHADSICYSPPLIESFIGADAVAMILASGFANEKSGLVSIDVGTNTEIAAMKGGEIWIASAASGPAFEGMSIECGTPGDDGAISNVQIDPSDLRPQYHTLGNKKPTGICGTGVISAIASMLNTGVLLPRGSFNRCRVSPWLVTDETIAYYVLVPALETAFNSRIILTQPDIRMLQQSKSSIRSALNQVLKNADLQPSDVTELYLTGIFGSGLKIEDAVRIGLFPDMTNANVKQIQGGASLGADLLHKQEFRILADQISSKANYIELTNNPEFERGFTENLTFP
ncbi:MAG: ASKHA domain-containing protein [Candidatus Thorarchaeota archaeon]